MNLKDFSMSDVFSLNVQLLLSGQTERVQVRTQTQDFDVGHVNTVFFPRL